MSKQVSPFAALSGAEKQIRWLEYQSIRLPYVEADLDEPLKRSERTQNVGPANAAQQRAEPPAVRERPQPPPEVPRTLPSDFSKSHHTQYDAVIARLKQAELQAQRYTSQASQ